MVRTQITLTEQQHVALREVAHRTRRSVAAVVREAIDATLAEDVQRGRLRRALDVATNDAGRSGRTDIARNHDAYLDEDLDG